MAQHQFVLLCSSTSSSSVRSAREGLSSTAAAVTHGRVASVSLLVSQHHSCLGGWFSQASAGFSPCCCCSGVVLPSLRGILKGFWFTVTGLALARGASKLIQQLLLGSSRVVALACFMRHKWQWLEECHQRGGHRLTARPFTTAMRARLCSKTCLFLSSALQIWP